jgi:alkylhydroperoxidase family enzyme
MIVVMGDDFAAIVAWFEECVLRGPGRVPAELRQRAAHGDDLPPEVVDYVHKVRRHAYQVTDADVAALKAAGWTDETIYELTVAAALGQATRRLRAGLGALRAAQQERS